MKLSSLIKRLEAHVKMYGSRTVAAGFHAPYAIPGPVASGLPVDVGFVPAGLTSTAQMLSAARSALNGARPESLCYVGDRNAAARRILTSEDLDEMLDTGLAAQTLPASNQPGAERTADPFSGDPVAEQLFMASQVLMAHGDIGEATRCQIALMKTGKWPGAYGDAPPVVPGSTVHNVIRLATEYAGAQMDIEIAGSASEQQANRVVAAQEALQRAVEGLVAPQPADTPEAPPIPGILARKIRYPSAWDVEAHPTLADALYHVCALFDPASLSEPDDSVWRVADVAPTMEHVAFDQLVDLLGYVQDGSDTHIGVGQDDATREYYLQFPATVGGTLYTGRTLALAISAAWVSRKVEPT